ncbi:MAG: hypothetical protein MI923_02875 [Phycisphaerales bacterium]|nr:hypothetical protein [Phycisphaerales bacterium]
MKCDEREPATMLRFGERHRWCFSSWGIRSLSVLCFFACGCTPAEKQEWDRLFSEPLFKHPWWSPKPTIVGEEEAWTIECNAYEGPNRRKFANKMVTLLMDMPDLIPDEVSVQHDAERSRVYYGTYMLNYVEARTDGDSHTKGDSVVQLNDAIKRDLKFIKQLAWGDQYPFFNAIPMLKPTHDVGPSEWDLRDANGIYTLNVGVTYPTPNLAEYKEAAIEWVKDLRKRGYEAYYYHDPDKPRTSVCVGTFGEDAFFVDSEGRRTYGASVQALRKREELGFNLENGAKVFRSARNPKTGATARMPNRSFLVKIPKRTELSER